MHRTSLSLAVVATVAAILVDPALGFVRATSRMTTFGHSVKNGPLPPGVETTTFEHNCSAPPCTVTQVHVPSIYPGHGDSWDWENGVVSFYIDGEEAPSVSTTLLELAWVGRQAAISNSPPSDNGGRPWGVDLFGHTAKSGGVSSTMRIPFGESLRVTIKAPPSAKAQSTYWMIVRGVESYPVVVGDIQLPDAARLKTYRVRDKVLKHLDFVHLANVSKDTSGAILGVKFDSTSDVGYTYLEACMRLYVGAAQDPIFLSSGAEDYFLSASYFDEGEFVTSNSGLTFFDSKGALSAYKTHQRDPVLFTGGMNLTWRMYESTAGCGDTMNCPNQYCPPGQGPKEFEPVEDIFKQGFSGFSTRMDVAPRRSAKRMRRRTATTTVCSSKSKVAYGMDRPGGDDTCFTMNATNATAEACAQACCEADYCQAWVFAVSPGPFDKCLKQGDKCCWLKKTAMPPVKSGVPLMASGTVAGHAPPPPPPGPTPPAPAPPGTAVYSTLVYVYEWPNAAAEPVATEQRATGATGAAAAFQRLAAMRAEGLTDAEEARLVDAMLSQKQPELVALLAVTEDARRAVDHVRRWLAIARQGL